MLKKDNYAFKLYQCTNMPNMLKEAFRVRETLFANELQDLKLQSDYVYSPDEAIEELGLEADLVEHLIEDYVIQIVKSNMIFLDYLEELKKRFDVGLMMDFTPLRDLAHKNLGVARNLRIADAEKLLYTVMKESDLEKIFVCLEALFACVTILRPQQAFDTLRLIKVKNSL